MPRDVNTTLLVAGGVRFGQALSKGVGVGAGGYSLILQDGDKPYPRFQVTDDGTQAWSDGYTSDPGTDVSLSRSAPKTLNIANTTNDATLLINGKTITSAGKIFYLAQSQASDIPTYRKALPSPSAAAEQAITTAIPSMGVDVLVAVFATDAGVPGAVDYPAGTGFRSIYGLVNSGSTVARYHIQVYKRDQSGVETLVRDEYSQGFSNIAVALQSWSATATAASALLATDRLVVKLYVQRFSGGNASSQVTTYFEGTAHTSQIQTTISAGAQGPPGPGVPAGGATGQVLTKTSSADYATAWQTPTATGTAADPTPTTMLLMGG